MAVSHERILTSTTTPTLITLPGREDGTSVTIQVQNLGAGAMYLGGEGVSSTNYGVSIVPGAAVTVDKLPPQDELYIIAQDPNEYVAVLRVSR